MKREVVSPTNQCYASHVNVMSRSLSSASKVNSVNIILLDVKEIIKEDQINNFQLQCLQKNFANGKNIPLLKGTSCIVCQNPIRNKLWKYYEEPVKPPNLLISFKCAQMILDPSVKNDENKNNSKVCGTCFKSITHRFVQFASERIIKISTTKKRLKNYEISVNANCMLVATDLENDEVSHKRKPRKSGDTVQNVNRKCKKLEPSGNFQRCLFKEKQPPVHPESIEEIDNSSKISSKNGNSKLPEPENSINFTAPFVTRKKSSHVSLENNMIRPCYAWDYLQGINLDKLLLTRDLQPVKSSHFTLGFLLALNDFRLEIGASVDELIQWLDKVAPLEWSYLRLRISHQAVKKYIEKTKEYSNEDLNKELPLEFVESAEHIPIQCCVPDSWASFVPGSLNLDAVLSHCEENNTENYTFSKWLDDHRND